MDPKTYIMTQMRIIEMGKIADSLDLDTFMQCIRNAETVAPMVDPTLYMKAQANLNAVKKLAEVAVKMKEAYAQTYRAVIETAMAGHMKDVTLESLK